ncbi:MAG TPA: patatin-like phospholipase family protein [Bryobacteraceae bacterium]|nr:patatin-like phospholipase family protein [Bryobacteraceae bacterium]
MPTEDQQQKALTDAVTPVMNPAGERATEPPADGDHDIALCLSGGGYRAMLFHVGSLWRLNELGYLPRIDRFSSVSGGSITAGFLALRWNSLAFDSNGVSPFFQQNIAEPIRNMARVTIDQSAILEGLFSRSTIGEEVAERYRETLFGDATLQDLPDHPRFVINATNVQSRSLFRFSKPYIWDYRVGRIDNPTLLLSLAVAASSAFPPVLSPLELRFKESDWAPGSGSDPEAQAAPFKTKVMLTDGGVYDNLGLETAWKNHKVVLVSDGGGETPLEPKPKSDWARHSLRVLELIDYQVRALRKRQLIASYIAKQKQGTYWGIRTDIADYAAPNALPAPHAATLALAGTPTRLECVPDALQERIMNWGYAVCDAAVRTHVDTQLPAPARFPYSRGI